MKNNKNGIRSREVKLLDKFVFYGTVMLTGASVMMIELLGTRIIGPFYGVSLVVWSSLLSVALLALSAGYFMGGHCADNKSWLTLAKAVFISALTIAFIPLLSKPVQLFFNDLGLRWGALASAFVLFSPALMFLGMAGPFVIRMAAKTLDSVGSTAGSIYAISTIGSVVGTLVLGFFLLPLFGTFAILLSISFVLLLLSVLLAIYDSKKTGEKFVLRSWLGATSLVVIVLGAQVVSHGKARADYNVLFEQETHYGWVRVVDQTDSDIRWLMSDASTIGVEYLPTGNGLLGYQRVVAMLPWFKPGSKRALLVGLGAGHLVNDLAKYGVRTDSIEIDPAVARAAQTYFSFKPTGKVIVGDARYQVQRLQATYDLIIHDCFTGGAEPFHLLSREMLLELKSKLKPGGVLAINFVGFTDPARLKPVQAIVATIDSVFAHRKNYLVSPGSEFSDYVFMMSDTELSARRLPNADESVAWLDDLQVDLSAAQTPPITDDYNPLEFLQIAKAEYYRDILIDRVGQSILFR